MAHKNLCQYVHKFALEMAGQCELKAIKHGSRWEHLPVEAHGNFQHQNERFYLWFLLKIEAWRYGGEKINWADVAVMAMICWIRELEGD